MKENSGKLDCYLNPEKPQQGAYLYLNKNVKKPEERIFRWYEGWMILIAPLAISVAIIIFIIALFCKGRLSASPVQRPRETFGKSLIISHDL